MDRLFWLIVAIFSLFLACGGNSNGTENDSEIIDAADTDADTDADADTDTDADADSDTDTDADADTDTDTDTDADADTDTDADADTDTGEPALQGIWVSRTVGSDSPYDVFEIDGTTVYDSWAVETSFGLSIGQITSVDSDAGHFISSETWPGTSPDYYTTYRLDGDLLEVTWDTLAFPVAGSGIDGTDHLTYVRTSSENCRSFMGAGEASFDGETGNIRCGFLAETLFFACDFYDADDSLIWRTGSGYITFDDFQNDRIPVGKRTAAYETHGEGYTYFEYDTEGRLAREGGNDGTYNFTYTYDSWDAQGRPLTGVLDVLDIDCGDVPAEYSYDDSAQTATSHVDVNQGSGLDCPAMTTTTIQTFNDARDLIEHEYRQDGSEIQHWTVAPTHSGRACSFEDCRGNLAPPPELQGIHVLTTAGSWFGTMTLNVNDTTASLSNVSLTNGTSTMTKAESEDAFCIKHYGNVWVIAFEGMFDLSLPNRSFRQAIYLNISDDQLLLDDFSGSWNLYGWFTEEGSGSFTTVP